MKLHSDFSLIPRNERSDCNMARWKAFSEHMRWRFAGPAETLEAWGNFKAGWDACERT